MKKLCSCLMVILMSTVLFGCADNEYESANDPYRVKGFVTEVIDGSTLTVKLMLKNKAGKKERFKLVTVSLLCVDTPELSKKQPYSDDAKVFAEKMLFGKEVELEFALNGRKDRSESTLAYVFIDDIMFNQLLIENGYARLAYVIHPDTKYVDMLFQTEKATRIAKAGIFSIPGYVQNNGFHPEVVGRVGGPELYSMEHLENVMRELAPWFEKVQLD